MAAVVASLSPHLIMRRFILNRPSIVSHAKKSFLPLLRTTPYLTSSTRLFCLSPSPSPSQQLENDVALLDLEAESAGENNDAASAEGLKKKSIKIPPPPSLSVKEKKELASYAHTLGKKLKSQQIGKSGVTDTVVTALIETLEANELLKLKIHNSCPGELEDAVKQLEESTGSIAVGQIGRTVILYRPSLALQLKAEQKKRRAHAQTLYMKRKQLFQKSPQTKSAAGQEPRQYAQGRQGGRRGSSRF